MAYLPDSMRKSLHVLGATHNKQSLAAMTNPKTRLFLSYSRSDLDVASRLRKKLEALGFEVFKDDDSLRAGDRWLQRLQEAVAACQVFVVLVGRDGIQRWVGAEVEAALVRHIDPHEESERLPIFPLLLEPAVPNCLPPFLAQIQAVQWDGASELPEIMKKALDARRALLAPGPVIEGCPFVGLGVFTREKSHLFFGRRRETLEALAGLGDSTPSPDPAQRSGANGPTYKRWLQIEGGSGSGKSSLVQAGLLPMVELGALWARTGFAHWTILGPMQPGADPVRSLAIALARALGNEIEKLEQRLAGSEQALANILIERKPAETAFLLVIDQFEELFTFADAEARKRFDLLLAHALQDGDCPLFVLSTVRSDFLHRFDRLPALIAAYNKRCRRHFLGNVTEPGLREIISEPARLAGLNVDQIREALVGDAAHDMAGALALVENALKLLWDARKGSELSYRDYGTRGRLAGMLASQADALLNELEAESGMAGKGRHGALELLLELTHINEGGRNTKRRITRGEAINVAGNGDYDIGQRILARLDGTRAKDELLGRAGGKLPLVVVSPETSAPDQTPAGNAGADRPPPGRTARASAAGKAAPENDDAFLVELIHETLVRARPGGNDGKPVGYWPTLYDYVEQNRDRDLHRRQLQNASRRWHESGFFGRWWNLAGWADWLRYRPLRLASGSVEYRFRRWSIGSLTAQACALVLMLGLFAHSAWWANANDFPPSYIPKQILWHLGLFAPLPEMVDIPLPEGGNFTMGCRTGRDDVEGTKCGETDAHPQKLDRPYALGKYELTFVQYDYYVWDMKRRGKGDKLHYPETAGWGREDRPVINVSWNDAQGYFGWLNERAHLDCKKDACYRLPSEAEWEWAARGTQQDTPYGWEGKAFDKSKANCGFDRSAQKTLPVTRPEAWANGFGLYDMIGNVWEWTADQEGAAGRVLRGGGWRGGPVYCRAARRTHYLPGGRYSFIGFRVCRGSPIETPDAGALDTESPAR